MRPVPAWLPILLGSLQAVGPVSTDMYLPAFPAMEASLHAPPGGAQITLAAWVLGLAVGQFIQGALTDRFGRRRPLLFGTAVYTAGAIACAVSPSMATMSACRFLAALGASASMVIPRAIVRDVSQGLDAARLMSRLILVLGAAPILAPTLGGLVLQFGTWRDIFWINALYGAVALVLAFWKLPNTLPQAERIPIRLRPLLTRSARILGECGFSTHVLMMSCYTFALFAYLGGSPTVFIGHYHLSPGLYAIVFGSCAAAYIACSQINIFVVRWLGLDGALNRASTLYFVLAACLLALAITDCRPMVFALVLAATHSLNGFIAPNATVGALRHHGMQAGSASALMGVVQFTVGASGGLLVGLLTDGSAIPMASLMLAGAVAGKIFDRLRPAAG